MKPSIKTTAAKLAPLPAIQEGRVRLAVASIEHTQFSGKYFSFYLDAEPLKQMPERQFLQLVARLFGEGKEVIICKTTVPTLAVSK